MYAFESSPLIDLAREIAANGLADRIEFIPKMSTESSLPEPVNLVVSDVRGVLPLFGKSLVSIIDARERFLAPHGRMIPGSDTLWIAGVKTPGLYRDYLAPWNSKPYDFDMSAALPRMVNSMDQCFLTTDQLLLEPKCLATLDYLTIKQPDLDATVSWTVDHAAQGHGVVLWFDSLEARPTGVAESGSPRAAGRRPVLISLASMATAASPGALVSPVVHDRKFYTGMAIVMLFTALVGFSRTYFLGLISGHATTITGRVPNATVHLHALLFMSWLILFIVQTNLVATHRVKVHRKLGYFGVALAAAMIVVGGRTAVEAARLGAVPPGAKPWNFIAIPFGDITTFAIFFLGAVLWRNDKDKHKRLMILASTCLMAAALVRWPGVLALGALVSYGLMLVFPIAGAVYDRWSRGRVHPVYWWGLALLVLGVAARVALLGSPTWAHATQSLFG